jgi:heme/copper-type cytochrome/quinol oxidase subunit 4
MNGITIVEGWMIACGLRELVRDDDLNENHVKVIIYGIAKSQITNHKLCPFGYMTMDSNNFLRMLSLVIVFFL